MEKIAPFLLRLFSLNSNLYAREKLMTNRVTRRIIVLESKYIHKKVTDSILTVIEKTTINTRDVVLRI